MPDLDRLRSPSRLQALARTGLLDTEPEEAFDRATRLAAALLEAPVALISLVDADRQFFKSACGLPDPDLRETPLTHSFCKYVVASEAALIIEDAQAHPLVCDNPAVRDFGVAAYLGVPLRVPGGEVVGTLCVIDQRPRSWTEQQRAQLQDLAASVMTEIALRQHVRDLEAREAALAESRERHRHLTEHINDVILRLAPDGTCLYVSPSCRRVLGHAPEALTGTLLTDLLHEADRLRMRAIVDAAAEGVPQQVQGRLRHADGHYLWAECTMRCSPPQASAAAAELFVVLRDVSERKAGEEALRQQKELLQTIFDHLPVMVALQDEQGHVWFVNRTWEQTLAWTPEELSTSGDLFAELFPETAEREAAVAFLQRGEAVWQTFRIRTRNGACLVTSWASVPLDGGMRICIAQDITRQEEAAAALQERTERLHLALHAAHMGTWDYHLQAESVAYSPEAESLLGLLPGHFDSRKQSFYDLVHAEDRERVVQATVDAVQEGGELDIEYRIHHSLKGLRWLRSVGRVYRDATGRADHMIGLVRDVTEEYLYQEGLLEARVQADEARRHAEEMSRMKGAFLSNMSHEIRTPLTAIIGFADVLLYEVTGEAREMTQLIQESGVRLLDTLNSVLDLAQLEGGSLKLRPEPVCLEAEARAVIDLFQQQASERGLYLRFEREGAAAEPLSLDRMAVSRILTNLVSNAVKFTQEGGVTVRLTEGPAGATVAVADTGVGMDAAFLPKLFEEFSQESQGLSRAYEGSGLGLAITKRLVDLVGGDLHVQSTKGQGTTVTVVFPTVGLPDAASAAAPIALAEPVEHRHILVVEDRAEVQWLIRTLLRPACRTDEAPTGEAALELAAQQVYDLVLMDISLGAGLGGVETMRALRRLSGYQAVPVVAVTAHALPGEGERLLREGFDGYLAKPFTRAQLLAACRPGNCERADIARPAVEVAD